jgi:hypothetical protein
MSNLGGAVFDPETITLMKEVLQSVVATIPVASRTSAVQAMLAERILKYAAQGTRDRTSLQAHALLNFEVHGKVTA